MSPRIAGELARLGQALEALEAAVDNRAATRTEAFATADAEDDAAWVDSRDIARRVDRVIDRLETVLGE